MQMGQRGANEAAAGAHNASTAEEMAMAQAGMSTDEGLGTQGDLDSLARESEIELQHDFSPYHEMSDAPPPGYDNPEHEGY